MNKSVFIIEQNLAVSESVRLLKLGGDASAIACPGQFVEVQIPGKFLRRPFSVGDWDKDSITVFYRIAGQGTEYLSSLNPGEKLDVLTGLGNGFDMDKSGVSPLLVGGGTGISPMYCLAKRFAERGIIPHVALGYSGADGMFLTESFARLGIDVNITTDDGSCGHHGKVTDIIDSFNHTSVYACGPVNMLRALAEKTHGGQFSLEARMGCGFGACMGCTIKTANGPKRVCKDGPVFYSEDLIW